MAYDHRENDDASKYQGFHIPPIPEPPVRESIGGRIYGLLWFQVGY
jgi:hypothetical protein